MARKTLELLESLMTGHIVTPDELDELLNEPVQEDLFLDYKHGDELKDRKKAARTVRKYLSGFANSAGGVLIIGVDQNTWTVTGCSAPGGGGLAEWAARCITEIAPYFSPPPRFQVIGHSDGDVLVASTARSLGLVRLREEGQPAHYLRIHDQTLKAPEYLVSDLMLGRRQHPYLRITDFTLRDLRTQPETRNGTYDLQFSLGFRVENEGLSWAEDARLGIISRAKTASPFPSKTWSRRLGSYLLSYVEVQTLDEEKYLDPCDVTHHIVIVDEMEPFVVRDVVHTVSFTIPIRMYTHWYTPYIWKAAAYLISRGAPPIWYQLGVTVNSDLLQLAVSNTPLPSESNLLDIEQLSGERPVVAWDGI